MSQKVCFGTSFLAFVLAAYLITAVISAPLLNNPISAQTANKKPNFLVIIGDDFGYSDLGSFGSEISTPNLDMVAKDGKVLTNYHAAPTCSPARVSLLTGVDYHIAGIGTMFELIADNQKGKPGYETYINDRVVTLPELLKDAGYHTYLSGKWHLSGQENQPGSTPADRGFQKSFSLLGNGANHWNDREYVPGWPVIFTENNTVVNRPDNNTKFSNEIYTDKILEYMKSNQADGKPFFAYLSFQAAHTPFMSPPEMIDKYHKIYSAGWDKLREQRFEKQKELGFWPSNMTNPTRLPPNAAWDSLSDDQKNYAARVFAVHAAMIEDMDKNIGRVIKYLKDTGQYDNTYIMFTSDNGSSEPIEMNHFKYASRVNFTAVDEFVPTINNSLQNLGAATSDFNYGPWGSYLATAPLTGFKTSFYEGGVRIPLVIKAPQSLSTGASPNSTNSSSNLIKGFVFVKDFTPTMLEMAGVSHPSTYNGHAVAPIEGKSLKGLLEGKVDKVYADDEAIPLELFNQSSVRMGDWVGIHDATDKTGVWKLFNIATDLGQNTNVASQHPDIVEKMKAAYEKYAKGVGVVIPTSGPFSTLFPEVAPNNPQTINLTNMMVPGYLKGVPEPTYPALH